MQELNYELVLQRIAEAEAISRRREPINHHRDRRPVLARFRRPMR